MQSVTSTRHAPRLLLFDLDGTLMDSGGAGRRAMNRAIESRFGVADAFAGVIPDGKTDPALFREMLAGRGVKVGDWPATLAQLGELYESILRDEMPASTRARLMPGVTDLLASLARRADVILGLLTGNLEATARIKLDRFDLNPYFDFGAFGSDHEERERLVPVAVARATAVTGVRFTPGRDILVIGDTSRDVRCALANGATAVGVATLNTSADALRRAGAHIVFEDLADTDCVLNALTP